MDCTVAIEMIAACGATQSLLSMLPHADLMPAVHHHDLARHMVTIDGLRGDRGGLKAPHLARHVTELRRRVPHIRPDRCVMIGDSLDDAEAARAHGIPCVLYTGGAHRRDELKRLGSPVADSLMEALRIAGLRT
jgi:phosphoglycolate phosphatase-like HAD superfamily hydrolase